MREWFWTAYRVAAPPPRAWSAKQLQRQLGCSYKTAWYRLHRLRRAMVNQARSKLRGGGTGRGGTAAEHKTLVLGAVEVLRWRDLEGIWQERAPVGAAWLRRRGLMNGASVSS